MIKVLICDDIERIREYIGMIVSADDKIEVVGMAASGEECVSAARRYHPDIILMDIQMETENAGIVATKKITSEDPKIKIIVLTMYGDELIMEAYHAGAVDYIIKPGTPGEIINRIKTVYANDNFIGPIIAHKVCTEYKKLKQRQESILFFINGFSNLTKTEREILKLLYLGYNKPQISKMRVSELSTTISHIKQIKKKLNFSSTKDLVSFLKKTRIFEEFGI